MASIMNQKRFENWDKVNLRSLSSRERIQLFDKAQKLKKEGLGSYKIAKELGTGRGNVKVWLRRNIELTERQKQIILGSLFGDGSLCIQPSSWNALFHTGCSEKNKEYLFWKYEELKSTGLFKGPPKPTNSHGYPGWRLRSIQHPVLTKWYDFFYSNKRKIATKEALDMLDELGLAVWWMDDGSYGRYLSTYCFTYEENSLIRDWIEGKWGVKFTLKRQRNYWYLSLRKEEFYKLRELISPYIIPCMSHKIATPSTN